MNKSEGIRKEFDEFCEQHPELRFWQALLTFIQKFKHNVSGIKFEGVEATDYYLEDTFYFETLTK